MTRSAVLSKLALTSLFAMALSILTFAAAVTELPQSRMAPAISGQN